jgi:cytidine deaminase
MAEKMNHETIDRLIEKSKEIMSQAHCPYSNFPVGAAILTKDGSVFDGELNC